MRATVLGKTLDELVHIGFKIANATGAELYRLWCVWVTYLGSIP
jgi:hypothetical protein